MSSSSFVSQTTHNVDLFFFTANIKKKLTLCFACYRTFFYCSRSIGSTANELNTVSSMWFIPFEMNCTYNTCKWELHEGTQHTIRCPKWKSTNLPTFLQFQYTTFFIYFNPMLLQIFQTTIFEFAQRAQKQLLKATLIYIIHIILIDTYLDVYNTTKHIGFVL